tara:strand:- start:31 stop:216 length:186 start_codon:yes stop_codon:yes gene_type:complete
MRIIEEEDLVIVNNEKWVVDTITGDDGFYAVHEDGREEWFSSDQIDKLIKYDDILNDYFEL